MAASATEVEAVSRRICVAFQRMKALGDRLHAPDGVGTGMRAVMESLAASAPQTVPAIARVKRVSRQHIQVLVNALVRARLVRIDANPADRRSPLVRLSRRGETVFRRMRGREAPVFAALARDLAEQDLRACLAALDALNAALERQLEGGRDGPDP